MLDRSISTILEVALKISPVVLLSGARQVGKSTLSFLVRKNYVVLDDVSIRLNAIENPIGFIESLDKPICIDEIQKAPNLLEAIKLNVDKNRINGSFLLTGSANLLDMKKTKDALAGRIIELVMYPLSLKEKNHKPEENIIDMLFKKDFKIAYQSKQDIAKHILDGGYPEILKLNSTLEKKLWFSSYISTYIERDARDLGDIREINNFFKFINVIAPRSATILNKSNIASDTGLKDSVIDNFLTILEQLYQIKILHPYSENIGKQFIKSPKLYMIDTGVMSHLLRIKDEKTLETSHYKGQLYETFICNELLKHLTFCNNDTDIFHYRTSDKKEIDFILKRADEIIAIEVKSSTTVSKKDFKHIIDFQSRSPHKVFGIVFYNGSQMLQIDKNNVALPYSFLF
jgi:predicted AAA+ superfamily ATPase